MKKLISKAIKDRKDTIDAGEKRFSKEYVEEFHAKLDGYIYTLLLNTRAVGSAEYKPRITGFCATAKLNAKAQMAKDRMNRNVFISMNMGKKYNI